MIENQPTPSVEKPKIAVSNPIEFDVNMRVANNNYELTRLGGLRGVLQRQIEAIDAQMSKIAEDSQVQLGKLNNYEKVGTEGES